ncbi:hypothetical protein [Mycolicibacterium confluentis]|uniref:Uncharacterized protein n=1 Tax=Mycolicibacterium confluentis TaxID=28047 RepID=A0A7I7Y346_9MYCO|nr:hypothetical protein [Mycolicibacterium confluentis]MCV7318101.1 hypothetical protein [Mycolicibacterium confluentis]ORV31196.1 hypothetical protein AWB99_12320 [Mycolicibacterium confluentis]BBZ36009.1 hypothetical protein MCNF_46140 [Mycolicibacterium confluentis]
MSTASPRALTVLVVPRAHTEHIVALLGDYSAAGLLAEFVWVDARDVSGVSTAATSVRGGRSEPVQLQQLLTAERYDRIRVVVLVPMEAPAGERVELAAEQAVEQTVRSSSMGARITLLRMLITRGGSEPVTPDLALVLEGWHNLLVAPEDSAGPGLGAVPWGRISDPLDLAQHVAPVIAGTSGLWAGVEQTPFDQLEILPGQTVRAVRGFYRRLDTTRVEARLRAQLFDPSGRLPLPRGGQVPVVYVEDVPTATRAMAQALWTKHRDVLRGPRLSGTEEAAQSISIGTALKMFFRFIGAALRRAPSAWLSAVLGSARSVVASTVQGTVFGRTNSAFSVVANTELADWQDLGRSAETLSSALGGPPPGEHFARQDLSGLWTDFVNGALTLADGGRRAGGLEPIQIGSGVGVVANSADVVPSTTEQFAGVPTSLAAVIGVDAVEAADVLGAATLRDRLRRAYQDPAAGVEARTTSTELDNWQAARANSYAVQVSSILVDFLQRARTEVGQLVTGIQAAAQQDGVDEHLRARQRAIGLILKTFSWALFAVLVILLAIAAFGWVSWSFALSTGGVLIGLYVVVSLVLFLLAQRDLFAEMNLRRSQESQLELMQANLRNALTDVARLSSAYGQLLAWSRVVGTVLRAPFGPAPATGPESGHLFDGLPRSTQVGVADPSPEHAANAAHAVQRRLYALGWLSRPWDDMVAAAAQQLREDPVTLFRMPGVGTGSGLDQWSVAVASGRVQPAGADALWARVEQMFLDDTAAQSGGISDSLAGLVQIPALGRQVPTAQFSAGITDHRPGHAAPFDASLFTNAAVTAGRGAVAVDDLVLTRVGLGYRAAVVQASDGLPPYEFAIFEVPISIMPGSEDDATVMISRTERTEPPGEDMVF